MQLVIKMDSNDVLDILRTRTQHNIKSFVKNMDYTIFEEVTNAIINIYKLDATDLIQAIKDGVIKIYDAKDLNELDLRFMDVYLLNNGQYLGIDYTI